jgi:hypothetical protein
MGHLIYSAVRDISMNAPSKNITRGSRRRNLIIISLITVVVVLVCSSLFIYKFLADDNSVRVKSSVELRDAVNNAEVGAHTDIALTKDISIGTLVIPAGADITLKSASNGNGFFRLVGMADVSVITVENGGRLTLGGIIVTRDGTNGVGVTVEVGGVLVMTDGEISGNTNGQTGSGGVAVKGGVFELIDGVISGNVGGGVSVPWGTFRMSGGKIIDNTVVDVEQDKNCNGGGVFNGGTFIMNGGTISRNQSSQGGGVYISTGTFTLNNGGFYNNG